MNIRNEDSPAKQKVTNLMEFLMTSCTERETESGREGVKEEVLSYNSNNNDIVCEASEVEVS